LPPGTKEQPDDSHCPKCGQSLPPITIHCWQCGRNIPADNSVCLYCRAQVPAAALIEQAGVYSWLITCFQFISPAIQYLLAIAIVANWFKPNESSKSGLIAVWLIGVSLFGFTSICSTLTLSKETKRLKMRLSRASQEKFFRTLWVIGNNNLPVNLLRHAKQHWEASHSNKGICLPFIIFIVGILINAAPTLLALLPIFLLKK
jgi:ribosomal protein S26